MSWSKAGSLLLRTQVRKSLESLILTATSGAALSVPASSTLPLKAYKPMDGVSIIAFVSIQL